MQDNISFQLFPFKLRQVDVHSRPRVLLNLNLGADDLSLCTPLRVYFGSKHRIIAGELAAVRF